MFFLSLLVLLTSSVFVNCKDDYPKVKTPLGQIRGYYKTSENGQLFEAYEGIPYARPPTGKLRFKAPEKVSAWVGELQATKLSDVCLQYVHTPANKDYIVDGSEDCLYVNVYVPVRKERSTPMPVIFWIHGGCFMYGAGNIYGAKYLSDKEVIFVTVNYRLGILGFLSTEDDVVPGNMGLKDQSTALRWVHENIEWFGGDPKKLTLTGLSAGGASVHYHYLSPMSAGLFQNGISVSGTALLNWAQTEKPLEKAKKLGNIMGCPTDNTKNMIECLRSRPGRSLVHATSEFMPWLFNPYTPFGPVVEKSNKDYFINRTPVEIIASGDVQDIPWYTGVVSEEGLYPVAEFGLEKKHMKYLHENWDLVAAHLLDYNYTVPKDKHVEVARKVREHYFGSKPIDRLNLRALTLMVGDRLFVVDAEKAARMQAKSNESPVWFYYYSYRAAQSLSDFLSGKKENIGVSHGDDSFMIVNQPFVDPTTTEEDKAMQKDLLNFWASVAYNRKPDFGIEWPQVNPTKKELNYLHISGPGRYSLEYNDNLGEKKLWNSIDFDENKLKRGSQNIKEDL